MNIAVLQVGKGNIGHKWEVFGQECEVFGQEWEVFFQGTVYKTNSCFNPFGLLIFPGLDYDPSILRQTY